MTGKQRIQSLRSVRMFFALAFSLFMAVNSWAVSDEDTWPEYITDLKVIGGTESEVNSLTTTLKNQGWIRIEKDLNDGAGGDYIYLLYKKSRYNNPNGGYITDIIIRNSDDHGKNANDSTYTTSGRKYYRVPHDGGDHFRYYKGNLNSNTKGGSTNMWILFTKDNFYNDKRVVDQIWFNTNSSGAVGNIDLNKGADGDYIYMHFSTVTKVNLPKTYPEVKGFTYDGSSHNIIKTHAYVWDGSVEYSGSQYQTNPGEYYLNYRTSKTNYAEGSSWHALKYVINKSPNNGLSMKIDSVYSEGMEVSPSIKGKNLSKGSISYQYSTSKDRSYTSNVPTEPGKYYVRAVIAGDYNCNTFTTPVDSFTIKPSVAYATVEDLSDQTYMGVGTYLCPKVTVKYKGKTLVLGTDYSKGCSNNNEVGRATMTITGVGEYVGSTTTHFDISPKSVADLEFNYDKKAFYTGFPVCPSVELWYNKRRLELGTDYTVQCENNVKAGDMATITVSGKGNYSGTQSDPFTIEYFKTTYIDEKGESKNCEECALLVSSNEGTALDGGWYVANGRVNMAAIEFTGDANIILADGAELTVNAGDGVGVHANNHNIAIYGQKWQSGRLEARGKAAGFSMGNKGNLSIYGGKITTTGDFGIWSNTGNIAIYGGSVSATGTVYDGILATAGDITLGWTDANNDRITVSSYVSSSGSVKIADGKALKDEDGNIYFGTLNKEQIAAIAGKTLTPLTSVHYIDENGMTQICDNFTLLQNSDVRSELPGGWYVATGTVNMAGIDFTGDANIILADGANLTVNAGVGEDGINANKSISIYGQENQTGSLSATSYNYGIVANYDVLIYGGVVSAEGDEGIYALGSIIVDGGMVSAKGQAHGIIAGVNVSIIGGSVTAEGGTSRDIEAYSITITGGSVNATGKGIYAFEEGITLGWTDPQNTRITASDFYISSIIGDATFKIDDGKAFKDEFGNIYFGTLTSEQISAIAGKTLTPQMLMETVPYINEKGESHVATNVAMLMSNENGRTTLAGGWYVAAGMVNMAGIDFTGDANIILADYAQLTVDAGDYEDGIKAKSITIYGQENQTGSLLATGKERDIDVDGRITITGGSVSTTGKGIFATGDITLGWIDAENNRIMASSYISENGSIKIADGKVLKDEDGIAYAGTLTREEIAAIAGKTLTPLTSVPYIDENGYTQICDNFTLLQNSEKNVNLDDDGWYVAVGTVNMAGINAYIDANIILMDGANLTVAGQEYGIHNRHSSLTIYGQEKQTGTISITAWTGISVHSSLTINGGNVSITGQVAGIDASEGVVTINGGNVSVIGKNTGIDAQAGSVTINGGFVSVTGSITTGNEIVLGWTDPEKDGIVIDDFVGSSTIRIAYGKTFRDIYGRQYSGTLDSWRINSKTLFPEEAELPVDFPGCGSAPCGSVDINGNYSGKFPVVVPDTVEVKKINFNREFTAGVPATVVLPFELPEGATTNAKFYYLKDVVQEGMSWVATMKTIGSKNLPAANTPYAVIVPDGGELQFDLKGKSAIVSTSTKNTTVVAGGDWLFVGVYTYKVWEEGDKELGLAYGFAGSKNAGGAAEGEFGKLAIDKSGDTPQYPYASPLRAYLRKRDESVRLFGNVQDAQVAEAAQAAKGRPVAPGESPVANYSVELLPESIDVLFIDEDENGEQTTFMARMNTRTGEFKMLRNYDLKGRKLNGAPRARGAYYGKKVLNK